MRMNLFIFFAIGFLYQCSTNKLTLHKAGSKLFEMSKSPCFGYCPTYDLTIFTNGLIKLNAKQNLKAAGIYTKTLTKPELKSLKTTLKNLNLHSYKNEYREPIADAPTTTITYFEDSLNKTIFTNYLFPDALEKFTDNLHNMVLDTMAWTLFKDDRQQQELLVELKEGASLSDLLKRYTDHELSLGKRLDPATGKYWLLIAMIAPHEVNTLLSKLKNDDAVKTVQLNKSMDVRSR